MIAFIPVRGGSKSIPLKNIKEIAGRPLIYWVAKAANDAKCIDKVYVATDSDLIKNIVNTFCLEKVEVIGRSAESASDIASTEYAMIEFAEKYEFDNIVLIQATSPLLKAHDIELGFQLFCQENTDSVLSVVRQKRFNWGIDSTGDAIPINYDIFRRPRRQEFDGYFVENGAFYITSKEALLKTQNRISGKIKMYEMDDSTYFEIDEPSDWIIVEQLLKNQQQESIDVDKHEIPDIKMFLTDCDGVLTDGGMYYSEIGDELKKFNTIDGMGFSLLQEEGIITGIITSENRELNRRRAEKMHLDEYCGGVKNKVEEIKRLCSKYNISPQNVAYVGDDINDLDAIKMVGFGCSVQNGLEVVKKAAKYVTSLNGGSGAVREIIELVLGSR